MTTLYTMYIAECILYILCDPVYERVLTLKGAGTSGRGGSACSAPYKLLWRINGTKVGGPHYGCTEIEDKFLRRNQITIFSLYNPKTSRRAWLISPRVSLLSRALIKTGMRLSVLLAAFLIFSN